MAPTVCVAEFPMAAATTVSARVRRRRRGSQSSGTAKQRRFVLEEMLRAGTIVETPRDNCSRRLDYADTVSDCLVADGSAECPASADEDNRRLVAERRRDLLSIVVRTIILVRRNRILQRRLNALRAETRRFLRSVLNNPEEQQRRSRSRDSSSTRRVVSTLSPPLAVNSRDVFRVTDDESSTSDKSEANRSEC